MIMSVMARVMRMMMPIHFYKHYYYESWSRVSSYFLTYSLSKNFMKLMILLCPFLPTITLEGHIFINLKAEG